MLRMMMTLASGVCLRIRNCLEELADAAGRQRVVVVRTVERQTAHPSDRLHRQGGEARCHSGSTPDSRRYFMTLPLSLRGSTSTTVIRRGTL